MASTASIPWKRLAAEVTAIVFGILLAFGIDAWWESRAIQLKTSLLLDALESEWESDLEKMDFTLNQITRYRRASESAIANFRSGSFALSAKDAEDLLLALTFRTFKPSLGALNTLLSNDLDNVSSPELRQAIASWPSVLEEVDPEEDALYDIGFLDFRDALARVSLSLPLETKFDPTEEWNTAFGLDRGVLALAAFQDEEFMVALTNRFGITIFYETQLREVRDILEKNLAILVSR